ncbi:MAG: hypothetical protein AAGE52_36890, partial [Myxococcota bacterium]
MRFLWVIVAIGLGCGDDDGGAAVDAGADSGTSRDAAADGGVMDGGASDAARDDGGVVDAAVDAVLDASPVFDAAFPDVSFPDGGGEPPWVDLEVGPAGSCDAFSACGGDVVGTWDVGGGCFEVDLEAAIGECPGAEVTRREGRGQGRVTFGADGFVRRVARSEVEADVFVPALCTAFVSCTMIETAIQRVAEGFCVEEASGACNCSVRQVTVIDDMDRC